MLTISNAKILKSQSLGYLTFGLHLAPATLSGYEVCDGRSPGCTTACLNMSGRGKFDSVQAARIKKTKLLFEDPVQFYIQVRDSVFASKRQADRLGYRPAFRPNLTSDIRWELFRPIGTSIFEDFEDDIWYDYTKLADRDPPDNYHLTFSRSETNEDLCRVALSRGINIAAVFDELPETYLGYPVINGDEHDLRFLDPKGVVVGLVPKGSRAKQDKRNFVIRLKEAA